MARSNSQKPNPADRASAAELPISLVEKIDLWSRENGVSTRDEAIQLLREISLSAPPVRVHGPAQRARATTLAEEQIDRMEDASATTQERADRKERLTGGPSVFRNVRRD